MTDRPQHGQHLAPGAQLPPKPAGMPATPKPAEPRDLAWARRCADDYKSNPTDARARNAAQCLQPLLDAYDFVLTQLKATTPAPAWGVPGEILDAGTTAARYAAMARLADGLDVPPETRDPATRDDLNAWNRRVLAERRCSGFEGIPCFKPAGHLEDHSNDPLWLRVGIDPCPARIPGGKKSCTKGYMHSGGHEWGPTQPIEAGPELPEQAPGHAPGCYGIPQLGDAGYCPCGKTRSWAANGRCVIGYQPDAPSLLELEAAHYRDTTRTIDDGKRPCEGRDCTNRTTMSCARCGRQNCRTCAAINLKTMTHPDGTPCAWRCRFPDCKTPDEDPWHLHCAAPFGGLTERRWRELNPETPSFEI